MATTEERLAALEAKLAQLTATTPTTYYTHQYSGEEIDAAVGRAVSGGALDTSVTNVSNQLGTFVRPNLLDNWYFGNPVNQRGQTTYTPSADEYTIDRWMKSAGTLNIEDGYISASLTNWGSIVQNIELNLFKALAGKTLTFSVLHKNGQLKKTTFTPDSNYTSTDIWNGFGGEYGTMIYRWSNGHPAILYANSQDSELVALKLELGDNQTLAHQDDSDRWILNEVPDYGEQLRRCQRYHLGDMQRDAPGRISGEHTAYCIVPIPVTMRQSSAVPVQTFSNYGIIIDKDGTPHGVNNASCVVEADSYLLFLVVSADTMPPGPCIWQDAHFSISKDL